MKRVYFWVVIMSLIFASVAFSGDNWTETGRNKSSIYYLDKTTIVNKGADTIGWFMIRNIRPSENNGIAVMKLKERADCSAKRLWTLQVIGTDAKGRLSGADSTEEEEIIAPGTVANELFKYLCNNKVTKP